MSRTTQPSFPGTREPSHPQNPTLHSRLEHCRVILDVSGNRPSPSLDAASDPFSSIHPGSFPNSPRPGARSPTWMLSSTSFIPACLRTQRIAQPFFSSTSHTPGTRV
ncbi:hypothetical protein FA13DRAFT_768096 [Coprinellus micaceus]|uniref:Uncharacterized protein n=1 Tax=Coprinellus micaceus TaxID=71717 RepID=A0A4Y7S817_COPMI|nr:hypothetical protein FA13DRAFT_768096 [Coprinellus micaceus]